MRAQIIADHAVDDISAIHLAGGSKNLTAGQIAPLVAGDNSRSLEPLVFVIQLGAKSVPAAVVARIWLARRTISISFWLSRSTR